MNITLLHNENSPPPTDYSGVQPFGASGRLTSAALVPSAICVSVAFDTLSFPATNFSRGYVGTLSASLVFKLTPNDSTLTSSNVHERRCPATVQ